MKMELGILIRQVSHEREIEPERLVVALEDAISQAARKHYHERGVRTHIDLETGEMTSFRVRTVVATPEEVTCEWEVGQKHHQGYGIVHGGVSSAGLELVGSAALHHEQQTPLRTASIRVNFLRPFIAGAQSVYEATALRIGRTSAVADAAALGPDRRPAVIARVTGYR